MSLSREEKYVKADILLKVKDILSYISPGLFSIKIQWNILVPYIMGPRPNPVLYPIRERMHSTVCTRSTVYVYIQGFFYLLE
jgi:hypothetical protein